MSVNARFLNEARQIETRWSRTKLLRGIDDRFTRSATAVLLENQRLMNEAMTDTGDIAQFKRISIPLVRRIYPQLISNKIVSVQPLLGPTGLVY
jgi:predicted nucleic acid-binding OB-fold protein